MEVEAELLKYAVLCVRMGTMTPSEAKLFVKSTSRSNPPRQGKRIVWIGSSESEWEIFAEAEKLRDDDRVDRRANIRKKEVMRRVLIVVGGILLLVVILTPAAYSFASFGPICMYGLVVMGFSKEPPPTALEKDFKILENEYGRF